LARHLLVQLTDDRGIDRAHVTADLDAQGADHLDHGVARHLEILGDLVDAELFPGLRHSASSPRFAGSGASSSPSASRASRTRSSSSGRPPSSISSTSEDGSSHTNAPTPSVSSACPAPIAPDLALPVAHP